MKLPERLRARYLVAADPLRSERRIEAVAVALAFALCLQLLYSGARLAFMSRPEAVLPAADALRAGAADAQAAVTSAQSGEIRERPLFWEGRRRVEAGVTVAAAEPEPEEAGQIEGVRLVGVFGSGDAAGVIALVKGEKRRILLGDAVQGWTLESVAADRAVLVSGEQREELLLQQRKVVASVQAPGPAKGETGATGQPGSRNKTGSTDGAAKPAASAATPVQDSGERRLGGRTSPSIVNGE